jgi:hypothetical protein
MTSVISSSGLRSLNIVGLSQVFGLAREFVHTLSGVGVVASCVKVISVIQHLETRGFGYLGKTVAGKTGGKEFIFG